jgi:hypothetical protein
VDYHSSDYRSGVVGGVVTSAGVGNLWGVLGGGSSLLSDYAAWSRQHPGDPSALPPGVAPWAQAVGTVGQAVATVRGLANPLARLNAVDPGPLDIPRSGDRTPPRSRLPSTILNPPHSDRSFQNEENPSLSRFFTLFSCIPPLGLV